MHLFLLTSSTDLNSCAVIASRTKWRARAPYRSRGPMVSALRACPGFNTRLDPASRLRVESCWKNIVVLNPQTSRATSTESVVLSAQLPTMGHMSLSSTTAITDHLPSVTRHWRYSLGPALASSGSSPWVFSHIPRTRRCSPAYAPPLLPPSSWTWAPVWAKISAGSASTAYLRKFSTARTSTPNLNAWATTCSATRAKFRTTSSLRIYLMMESTAL